MMKNLGQMMKQAQEMQQKLADMQQKLAEQEVDGQSGGGMVKAMVTGKGVVKSIKIDPEVVDKDDVEVLEDLVVAAVNDARARADQMVKEESEKLMQDMGLPPGMNLPF